MTLLIFSVLSLPSFLPIFASRRLLCDCSLCRILGFELQPQNFDLSALFFLLKYCRIFYFHDACHFFFVFFFKRLEHLNIHTFLHSVYVLWKQRILKLRWLSSRIQIWSHWLHWLSDLLVDCFDCLAVLWRSRFFFHMNLLLYISSYVSYSQIRLNQNFFACYWSSAQKYHGEETIFSAFYNSFYLS